MQLQARFIKGPLAVSKCRHEPRPIVPVQKEHISARTPLRNSNAARTRQKANFVL